MADNAKWYVIHTYSGYENAVKAAIEKSVVNRHRGHRVGCHEGSGAQGVPRLRPH